MYNFCKIVQDLLPNYMEKTTFEETDEFIEEHLAHCEECTKIYNDMKLNLEVPTENIDEGVDYMKKFNKEVKYLKLWQKILIVLMIIIGILSGIIIYRYSTFTKLHQLESENMKIANIYFSEEKNGTLIETWKKDNIMKMKIKKSPEEELYFWRDLNNKETYMIFENEKRYTEVEEDFPLAEYPTVNSTRNRTSTIEKLKAAIDINLTLKTIKYDNKDCYYIEAPIEEANFNRELIFEKKTGFLLFDSGLEVKSDKSWEHEEVKITYKLDVVTDEDIAKPDLTQYKMN